MLIKVCFSEQNGWEKNPTICTFDRVIWRLDVIFLGEFYRSSQTCRAWRTYLLRCGVWGGDQLWLRSFLHHVKEGASRFCYQTWKSTSTNHRIRFLRESIHFWFPQKSIQKPHPSWGQCNILTLLEFFTLYSGRCAFLTTTRKTSKLSLQRQTSESMKHILL